MTNDNYSTASHTFSIANVKGISIDSRGGFIIAFKDDAKDIDLDYFSGLEVLKLWRALILEPFKRIKKERENYE